MNFITIDDRVPSTEPLALGDDHGATVQYDCSISYEEKKQDEHTNNTGEEFKRMEPKSPHEHFKSNL